MMTNRNMFIQPYVVDPLVIVVPHYGWFASSTSYFNLSRYSILIPNRAVLISLLKATLRAML